MEPNNKQGQEGKEEKRGAGDLMSQTDLAEFPGQQL